MGREVPPERGFEALAARGWVAGSPGIVAPEAVSCNGCGYVGSAPAPPRDSSHHDLTAPAAYRDRSCFYDAGRARQRQDDHHDPSDEHHDAENLINPVLRFAAADPHKGYQTRRQAPS